MRVKYSIINISAGLANQLIITILSFVSRTVFINSLGIEYLGINGLFTNILAMLTLAEAGIGASIMYSLYKPVAENDQVKIKVLMNFYRKAYLAIALVIFILGISLMPFLGYIIKDSSVENTHLIYSIFLINTVLPYLFVYKNSYLNVCQKGYIVTAIYSVSSILSTLFKIGILYYTENFILYLIVESLITLFTSIILVLIVNRMYPFLKEKISDKLDFDTKRDITKNIKAIVLQNIGNYLVFGTDNIIISSFVSIAAVGLYSNYNMLIDICRTFINQVFNNIYHSVGNLVASENKETIFSIYKVYWLLNFWFYSFFTIVLSILIEPFITLWLGKEFLMSGLVLLILMLTFYERGMRNAITTVKTTSGIFHEDRYAPIGQAIVNLVLSIVLVQKMGIAGVFLGTLISAFAVPFWRTPYLVYKKVFLKPISQYFLRYIFFAGLGILTFLLTNFIVNFIPNGTLVSLIFKACICLIVPNIIYVIVFYKTNEFKYLLGIIKSILKNFMGRLRIRMKMRNVG